MKKLSFFAVFCFLFFACAQAKLPVESVTIKKADGSSVQLATELAQTSKEREYGFMNRKNIPDGTGMIFIFENDQILNFWMKDTPTALSIAYIDSKGKIRNIFDMTPFSKASVSSTVSVRYALEVPQGWFFRQNISVGDRIDLSFLNK